MSPDAARAVILAEIDSNKGRWVLSQRQRDLLIGFKAYILALTSTEMTRLASFLPLSSATDEPS